MAKIGRKQKPYETTWGQTIPGLNRQVDGRWRIISTGFRFTEPDEAKAIAKFRSLQPQPTTVKVEAEIQPQNHEGATLRAVKLLHTALKHGKPAPAITVEPGKVTAGYELDPAIVWPWVRDQITLNALEVSQHIGVPNLLRLSQFIPKPSLKLAAIAENYRENGTASAKHKARALKVWKELVEQTQAKTLDDLTTEKLLAFKRWAEGQKGRESGGYITWYFGCIKAIIGFAKRNGMDAEQVASALSRCAVLWTSKDTPAPKPTPISRDDLHALLKNATPIWRATILMGLNCLLHLEEALALEWQHIDLAAKTYCCIRTKTADDRIPRAAVLWDETIAALKALPRRHPKYVFTSKHGTRYNRESRGNKFALLRLAAGINTEVTFDWIKDGGYTEAINDEKVEERFARVLAGHKSDGLQDNYVLRNPKCTKGACDAVYRAYAPFPEQPELTAKQRAALEHKQEK